MIKEVLVVPRNVLFRDGAFQGLMPFSERDFISIVNKNHIYMERDDALENNSDFIQIIPYVWLVNSKTKKAFLYRRGASKGEYKENRHLGNYSGGVGGHIDRDTDEHSDNPIEEAMMRELREEVIIDDYPNPKFIGYIKDDSNMFNKVHFGIVALADLESNITPADGMEHGRFYSVEELERIFSDPANEVENWTRLSWLHVKKYLGVDNNL